VTDPLFWLVLSLLFVTISLTIVLAVAIPALKELARAARSAEKLFDTLRREFPPTLQAIRLTGLEISDLTDDVSEGVQSAGQVVKQVDQSLSNVRKQAQRVQSGTRNVVIGLKTAWRTFTRSPKPSSSRRSPDRLPPPRSEAELTFGEMAPAETRSIQKRMAPEASTHAAETSTPVERNRAEAANQPYSASSTYAKPSKQGFQDDRQLVDDVSQDGRERDPEGRNNNFNNVARTSAISPETAFERSSEHPRER